jgi:hypothetical protein
MILVDHQRSIRQICRSASIETAISFPFVGMTDVKADPVPLFQLRLESMCNCSEPAFASQEFSVIGSSDGATASALGASAGRGPGSRAPSRKASRPSGFDPSRDHGSLAGGTRLRVPPSFHSGVVITAPLRVPS